MKYKELVKKLQSDQVFREKFTIAAAAFLKEIGVEDVTEETIRKAFAGTSSSVNIPEASLIEEADIKEHFLTMAMESVI